MSTLTGIDFAVIAVYFIGIIIYGISKSKNKTSEDYFLGGRSLTWPVIGISLFAANISSSTLIGLAGSAYLLDTTVYNYEWYAVVVLVFFAIFFLPFYLRTGVYTMPEFLEKRYDSRSRYYFSFITVVGNVLIDTAASLYVGTIVIGLIFPDLSPTLVIIILAVSAAAYTIPGGLNSVVRTEVIQAIILIFGSVVLTYFAFDKVGGWSAMIDQLNGLQAAGEIDRDASGALSVVRENSGDWWRQYDAPIVPWWGLLTGVPLLGFYFWANNQFMVQRVLSAKDLNHGRWGALFAGLLKLPVILIMVIPGTLAFLLYRNSTDIRYLTADGPCTNLMDCIDFTYPTLLFDLLPTGLLGLVVAGLLAAMMSSISATFNSASTLITMDFVHKIRPNLSSKQLVRSGQIATLVLVVLASAWAPLIGKYGNLFAYLQDVLSYIAPPVVAVFILGLFWKRANATGSIASLLMGLVLSAIWVIGRVKGFEGMFFELHFLLRTAVLFVCCLVIHVTVSLATAAPPAIKTKNLTWSPSLIKEETLELRGLPWYKNYRYLSILLLLLTAMVVGYFW
ncbi:MAG: sodium:solute symporter [Sediminicola sp.]|tara:strand:+ start:23757 stop:25448 length:1692 start_codon:yes stop_codon:yes gene_type:complete